MNEVRNERNKMNAPSGSVLSCPKCGASGNGRAMGYPYVNGEFRNVEIRFNCPSCAAEWSSTAKILAQNTENSHRESRETDD
jgi:hypothetical protein